MLEVSRLLRINHGSLVLVRGLLPTLIGYGFEGAVKFGVYEFVKRALSPSIPRGVRLFVASVVAGAAASITLVRLIACYYSILLLY